MIASIYVYIATICAAVLPYFLVKAIDKECKKRDYYLLGMCLISGLLVFTLIGAIIA